MNLKLGLLSSKLLFLFSIFAVFFAIFFYFAHEIGQQLVAETSRAVFVSVKSEIKAWTQRE
jgi:hypothetical protein